MAPSGMANGEPVGNSVVRIEPDPSTLAAYDAGAEIYATNRRPTDRDRARRFAEASPEGPRLDLGCGPGLWFDSLGPDLVGADASLPMLTRARSRDGAVPLVQALLEELPFATGAFAGVWANKCLQHVEAADLPLVLADLRRIIRVGGRLDVEVFTGSGMFRSDDDLPGRRFTLWDPADFTGVLVDAGFAVDRVDVVGGANDDEGPGRVRVTATRRRRKGQAAGAMSRMAWRTS